MVSVSQFRNALAADAFLTEISGARVEGQVVKTQMEGSSGSRAFGAAPAD
jgi:hypothetical protein